MKKIRQIVAGVTVAVIIVLLVGTLICAVTGSKYFFGMLFLTIVVPVVLWVFMWFTHLIYGNSEVIPKKDMELTEQDSSQMDTLSKKE